jgi:hypothetical protein
MLENEKPTNQAPDADVEPQDDASVVKRFYDRARALGLTEQELFPVDVPSAAPARQE